MAEMGYFDQHEHMVRCEQGVLGLEACRPGCAVVVVVDVLSFSTAVAVAVERGAVVLPYRFRDSNAAAYAAEKGALLASQRRGEPLSLSPAALRGIAAGTRLVLPSPNGATLSMATGDVVTLAGCLRNAGAVAAAAARLAGGRPIAVIAAGERWPDGSLRPALEDLLGAGAIIQGLPGGRSPEAAAAEALFAHCRDDLLRWLRECGSGRELIGRGYAEDVAVAAELNASDCVPILRDGAYIGLGPRDAGVA